MESGLVFKVESLRGKLAVTVLYLHGWLDAQSEEQLLASARKAYDGGSHRLLLDMAELDTLTSAGIRALQKVHMLYTPVKRRVKTAYVKICNVPPQIRKVLEVTGFLQSFPSYESKQAALDSFSE